MRRLILGAFAAAVVLNLLLTVFGRGSFFHTILAVGIAAYAGLPAFIAGTVFYALRARYRRAQRISVLCWTVSAVAVSLLVSLWAGTYLALRDIADAQDYCDAIVVRLDEVHQSTGHYPSDLSAVRHDGDGPRLVRQSLSYSSDGNQFELTFSDPRGIMNGLAFRSRDRRWVEWD